jgi:hypothetical protein
MAHQPVVFNYQDADNFEIDGYIKDGYKPIGHGVEKWEDNTTAVTFDGLTGDAAWKISVLVTQFLRDYKSNQKLTL